MGWILLFLVLIAAAFGVLGLVVKATLFLVLTILMTVIVLAYVAFLIIRRQAKRLQREFEKRLQPPTQDYRY